MRLSLHYQRVVSADHTATLGAQLTSAQKRKTPVPYNVAERALRAVALGRKNYLLAASFVDN